MKTNQNRSLNPATTGIIFYLADGTIQSCNTEAESILGYTAEQLIKTSYFELPWQILDSKDYSFSETDFASIFFERQSYSNVVIGFKKLNKELIVLSVDATALFRANSSEPYGVEVSFKDITENTVAEFIHETFQKTKISLSIKDELTELLPGVIYVYDIVENHSVYVNSEFYDSLGYTFGEISEFKPSFISQVMHSDDFTKFSTQIKKLTEAEDGEVCKFEYRMRHKNGDWRWFSSQDKVYSRTADGSVKQIVGIARDITNRKKTETALRKSEDRLKLATEASGIGMWFWDLVENTVEWTRLGRVIFGLPLEEKLSLEECFRVVHLEDSDRVISAISRAIGDKTEYDMEYRVVSDNSIRWIAAKGRGFYDKNGKPLQMAGTVQDITERKDSEKRLQENEQLLRFALSNAKAGTWNWDIINQEVVWSPENYELYGVDPQIKPLRYQDWSGLLHPDDTEKTNLEVERILSGESSEFRSEFRIIHPQKGVRWLLGVGNVTRNHRGEPIRLSGINLDISDLSTAKEALQKREYELKLLTEVIPQQVWTALPNGEPDYFNQRWLEYTGFNKEQSQGLGWESVIHPDDLQKVNRNWHKAIVSGCDYNMELRLRRGDGEYNWFLVIAKPLWNDKGEITKWYGTNTNITKIKKLESQLLQQAEDLSQANDLKDEFLAIVSHELRTPLNPILGWSQLLAGGRLDAEKTATGIEIIQRNAKLQAQLIEDLLDVSRILRGKIELKKIPVNLESIIRSALTTVNLSAEAKSIEIETLYEPDIGQVLGDAGRLQQIVWNLLSNAIKFTPEGGKITIKLERIGSQGQIEVKDTGNGIEPNFLPYVFERFRQAESSSTRQHGGLGLGLAIVRYLTELHGGTATVASLGLNRGTTFKINFPLIDRQIPEEIEINSKPIEPLLSNRFSGIKILAIDDEVDSLNLLSFVLEQEGAQVTTVTKAEEAFIVLKKSIPDLIISDIGMPKIDGYGLITQIRQLSGGKEIPAIAVTAYAAQSDRKRALQAGFNKHIAKPINIPKLIATITKLI